MNKTAKLSDVTAEKRSFVKRLRTVRGFAGRYGWPAALYDLFYRLAHRLGETRVLVAVILRPQRIAPQSLQNPHGYQMGFLSTAQIAHHNQSLGGQVVPNGGEGILARGDRCYGILDGDRLISFGWYSNRPTSMDRGLEITFDPRFVYMYKGYTDPDYRGQALHALGMAQATKAWAEEGFEGLVSFVAANNYASLHSCNRLGYEVFGRIRIAKLGGRLRAWHSSGCKQYAFGVRVTDGA